MRQGKARRAPAIVPPAGVGPFEKLRAASEVRPASCSRSAGKLRARSLKGNYVNSRGREPAESVGEPQVDPEGVQLSTLNPSGVGGAAWWPFTEGFQPPGIHIERLRRSKAARNSLSIHQGGESRGQ